MKIRRSATQVFSVVLLCLWAMLLMAPKTDADDTTGVENVIIGAYKNMEYEVDISQFKITGEELDEIYDALRYGGKLPWYTHSYEYTYNTETKLVRKFRPIWLDPAVYDYALYEQKVAQVLAEVVQPDMSQWQIALVLHDYLAANCSYDEALNLRQGYDALVGGSAVCSGYAFAYMDLMNRAGVPCEYVVSEGMNHAWNLVNCNGNWLHVDVTWDDPVSNVQGRVRHHYFLISDRAISDEDHGHYGWETDRTCPYTEWDTDRFWHGVDSAILYSEDGLSSFQRQFKEKTAHALYIRDRKSGDTTRMDTVDLGYINLGTNDGKNYFYQSYGLSYFAGRLYYCDMANVYSILPDGSGKQTVYTHNYSKENTCISGCHVENGVLHLTLRDHEGNLKEKNISLQEKFHRHSYTSTAYAATCQSVGYEVGTCECGIEYRVIRSGLGDHAYDGGRVTEEPTYFSTGTRVYTCTHCGAEKTEAIPRLKGDAPTDPKNPEASEDPAIPTLPTLPSWPIRPTQPSSEPMEFDWSEHPEIIGGIVVVILLLLLGRKKKHK